MPNSSSQGIETTFQESNDSFVPNYLANPVFVHSIPLEAGQVQSTKPSGNKLPVKIYFVK